MLLYIGIKGYADNEYSNMGMDIITSVSYDYEIFQRHNGQMDCKGALRLIVDVPETTQRLLLYRTSLAQRERYNEGKITYDLIRELPYKDKDTVHVVIPNVYWDAHYKLGLAINNGWVYSPDYEVKSLISETDLDCLLAPVTDIQNDRIIITASNHSVKIETHEEILLNLFRLDGSILFTGIINESVLIPVDTPCIIARYVYQNKVFTKKILTK